MGLFERAFPVIQYTRRTIGICEVAFFFHKYVFLSFVCWDLRELERLGYVARIFRMKDSLTNRGRQFPTF